MKAFLKFLFAVILFVAFISLQAMKLIDKYFEKEVIVTSKIVRPGILKAPMMTICGSIYSSSWNGPDGWTAPTVKNTTINEICSGMNGNTTEKSLTMTELEDCYKSRTLSLKDIVKRVLLKHSEFDGNTTSHYHTAANGRCHSIQLPEKLKANMLTDAIKLVIDETFYNKGFYLFFHDPKFFMMATNPLSLKTAQITHVMGKAGDKPAGTHHWYYISAKKHDYMEFDASNGKQMCVKDENYKLMDCIKQSNAKKIGCTPFYDPEIEGIPRCTKKSELKEHEDIQYIVWNEEKSVIEKTTGCLSPCNYFEYEFVGKVQEFVYNTDKTDTFIVGWNFVSTDYEELKEGLAYPLVSFVAEFGGTLGLFLGFSFMSLWDWMEVCTEKAKYFKQVDLMA